MSARTRNMLRLTLLLAWLVLALIMVGTTLAQDGGETPSAEEGTTSGDPQDLDDIAVRLMPLLVGAALIERALEVLFTWVERAILDASHFLHGFAVRVTGLVQMDFRHIWDSVTDLTKILVKKETTEAALEPLAGDADSSDPEKWPLAMLEARLIEAKNRLQTAEAVLDKALSSPEYVSRKKIVAAWLSIGAGIALAVASNLRLFKPLGVEVPHQIEGGFDAADLVLAGILMGLGTEYVHQVIGILIKGKGLLGRAAPEGSGQIDPEQVRMLAELAVSQEFESQVLKVRSDLEQTVAAVVHPAIQQLTGDVGISALSASPEPVRVTYTIPAVAGAPAVTVSTGGTVSTPTAVSAASAPATTTLPPGTLRLYDVTVTVRKGGVTIRSEPSLSAPALGDLSAGVQRPVDALLWDTNYTWLHIQGGWIAGEDTDFARSSAYSQVSKAWYESAAVLAFRRKLVRDLLRVRRASISNIDDVDALTPAALADLEDRLTRQTVPPQYVELWRIQERLGLPDPFEFLPVHTSPPAGIDTMEFSGFGPNTFAFHNWQVFYQGTRGMHSGVDFIVPEGSPLIAVADGVIVELRFLANDNDRSLALRPYLPAEYRKPDGGRVLSNLVVAYGHLTGDPTSQIVNVGDEVQAGDIIGTSGWPVYALDDGTTGIQYNNAHLHLETHFITDGDRALGSRTPINPMLFWTPRLIAWQARLAGHSGIPPYPSSGQPYGRLGFFSVGAFSYDPRTPLVWGHDVTRDQPWPEGVYDLSGMIAYLQTFEPYTTT